MVSNHIEAAAIAARAAATAQTGQYTPIRSTVKPATGAEIDMPPRNPSITTPDARPACAFEKNMMIANIATAFQAAIPTALRGGARNRRPRVDSVTTASNTQYEAPTIASTLSSRVGANRASASRPTATRATMPSRPPIAVSTPAVPSENPSASSA